MAKIAITLLLLSACASHGILSDKQAGVLDAVWTAAGPLEIAFCLDGEQREDGSWKVTDLTLPPQIGDSVSVMFQCPGSPGWGHNHALLGGIYAGAELCEMSPIDLITSAARQNKFHVLWCGPGKLIVQDLLMDDDPRLRLNGIVRPADEGSRLLSPTPGSILRCLPSFCSGGPPRSPVPEPRPEMP